MEKIIDQLLSNFSTQKNDIGSKVIANIHENKSKVIEIIGESGSGKSFMFEKLNHLMQKSDISHDIFIPNIFKFNQFREIVKKIATITDDEFNNYLKEAEQYQFTNKYDLFYFLTERLSEDKKFHSQILVVYECFYLDQYCIDFMQYLVQYPLKQNIIFIAFTREKTFPFSEKLYLKNPRIDDIRFILSKMFPDTNRDFTAESEIINSISHGNLYIIQYILENFFEQDKDIDLSNYLDQKISVNSIYEQKISNLNESELTLLYVIFLLDTQASKDQIKTIKLLHKIDANIKSLLKKGLIFQLHDAYFVKKVYPVKIKFLSLSATVKEKYYSALAHLLNDHDKHEFAIKIGIATQPDFTFVTHYLNSIKDFNNSKSIWEIIKENNSNEPQRVEILYQLGLCCKQLGAMEEASEYFREALKIAVHNSLPLEFIIYHLADSLLSVNSSTFALEILKKYSPSAIDNHQKWELLMLKAKILMEMEQFENALATIQQTSQITSMIDEREVRYNMQAEEKKLKGLIFYYINDLSKAEEQFEEAEKLFKQVQNISGLAAIYNNLGGLTIFRGEWKKTETLFKKSLKFEKKRYNLNGISYCYNNLGSLWGDQGNYEKALFYLNEALQIQILLSDSYQISTFYFNIGLTYKDNGDYEKAIESLNKSLEIAINFHLFKIVDAALNALGAIHFKSGNWTKAIDYYKQAIEKAKSKNFHQGLCESYNNLGELFEKRGEYNLAMKYYQKSKELLPNISDDFLKAEIHGNIGSILTVLHQFGKAYKYLVESYEFFKNIEANDKFIEASQKLAYYFLQTRNYETANYHLEASLNLAKDMKDNYHIGKAFYLFSLLHHNDIQKALEFLKSAIEKFIQTKNNFDLAIAKYQYSNLLLEKGDWEQALQILNENRKIIKKFDAINFLEKNDILIQNIKKKYSKELKEARQQDTLLNDFYEITQHLNSISDFDSLLESSLDKLIDFAEADGGIFCLYNNQMVTDAWEYVILKNFSSSNENYSELMDIIQDAFDENSSKNIKQPSFAPEFNNIIAFPLTIRNEKRGVICLFVRGGSHYFTEKMYNLISALCNQIVVIVENISYKNLEQSHATIREELASTNVFTNIIGKSPEIQKIFRMIEKIKNTPTTVLLEGPSGTGKELIARAIHYNSNRRNKNFIAQYCGALSETLLESELFGHVKGSFTGATQDKKGLFEIANGGSFFLDEIADISLSTQAKLLRFLQEGEIKKVGSTITEKVDVRVICATNVSLKEKVEKGEFRQDLYYRLNVIRIEVPSLHKRKSDIPLLAIHFLDKYCKKIEKKVKGITDEAMKYLQNYNWPGNIRQLENEIERAVTLADNDSYIKPVDLSEEIFRFHDNVETINLLEENKSLKNAVEELEIKMIMRILEETDWNQTQTAKKLGLSRQGLIKKMHRYNLEK